MAVSMIFVVILAVCSFTQGFQFFGAFHQTNPSFQVSGPGAAFTSVLSYTPPPERLPINGFGPRSVNMDQSDDCDSSSTTSDSSSDATASTKSFSQPPPSPGEASNPSAQTCGVAPPFCTKSRYRSIDGSCNNLQRHDWGVPQRPFGRLTPFKYADGISALPRSVSGRPLPNARELSIKLFPDRQLVDPIWDLNTQQWGQIVTHDITLTVGSPQNAEIPTVCCDGNGQLASDVNTNPACAPVLVPPNDPIHAPQGTQCLNFVRSVSTRTRGCTPPNVAAEPISGTTAFMDLSLVYGHEPTLARQLRTGSGGRLRTAVRNHQEWPPQDPNVTTVCTVKSPTEPCYLTGDSRVNQNPQLTLLQVILLREHNRIADILASLNPHWNDETLYQESRRIHIAQYQHINYYEYLPILLGYENVEENKLIYKGAQGYVNDYNPGVDPTILDEFATAAFRHFHTLIRGYLQLITENRRLAGVARLSNWFNRPLLLELDNSFNNLARGLTAQHMDYSDQFFDSEITDFLFRGNNTFGGDLRATDIQRGRDHALGSYVTTRAACQLPVPLSFEDMTDYISEENVAVLKKMYEALEDVDLVVAGSLESLVPGSLIGPTFLCILTEQFYRTRVGDRFFYENGADKDTAFTPSQLDTIRKGASMARLLCDNAEIELVQPKAFLLVNHRNKLVPCNKLPFVDLTLWQDARVSTNE